MAGSHLRRASRFSPELLREFASLELIADNWPKTVIVHEPTPLEGRGGIRLLGLADFLEGQ